MIVILIAPAIIFSNRSYGLLVGSLIDLCIVTVIGWGYHVSKRDENRDMYLSECAKEELKEWIKFKNFIESYTLLEDRNFEEIVLYERYIPYAMVLDINNKYKEAMIKIINKKEINLILENFKKYKQINNVWVEYFHNIR